MKRQKKYLVVAGARPNFMKVAPILKELKKHRDIEATLVHTGQHYDASLSDIFFADLGIAPPDINLAVGSKAAGAQTGEIMGLFGAVLADKKPDVVIVTGDVNSTIACALASKYAQILVAHVEAGLRSFDRTMPEEINRIATDAISDFLFCTEKSGVENLRREGVSREKIFLVGNVMIDTLRANHARALCGKALSAHALSPRNYIIATLHRPANVDSRASLKRVIAILKKASRIRPVIFPVHPRTKKKLEEFGVSCEPVRLIAPLGYLDFLELMSQSLCCLTDSGGIQEETTALGVPCLTMRENTERPVTVSSGTNAIVGTNAEKILSRLKEIERGRLTRKKRPPLWDGKAASRIVSILKRNI